MAAQLGRTRLLLGAGACLALAVFARSCAFAPPPAYVSVPRTRILSCTPVRSGNELVLLDLRFDAPPGEARFAADRNERLEGMSEACRQHDDVRMWVERNRSGLFWVEAVTDLRNGRQIIPESRLGFAERRDRIAGWIGMPLGAIGAVVFLVLAFHKGQAGSAQPGASVKRTASTPGGGAAKGDVPRDPETEKRVNQYQYLLAAGAIITLSAAGFGAQTLHEFRQLQAGSLQMVQAWRPIVAAYELAGFPGAVAVVGLGVGFGLLFVVVGFWQRSKLKRDLARARTP